MTRLVFFVAVVATSAGVWSARAQHAAHTIPVVPIELLERRVSVRAGIGIAHDPVNTRSAEAQRFYDQGLAYLHSYVWIEAARSFNQALKFDPALAIGYAGLSIAYTELNKAAEARAALQKARDAAAHQPAHDQRHITVRALQAEAESDPQNKSKLAAYRQALDAAVAAHPKDVELLLLRGVAESPDPADRGQGAVAGSIPFFQKALALSPNHSAAQHYLTHAYENAGRIDEALRSGGAFAKAAPNVPHARHMYGHDLRRAGRTIDAIAEFEAADRLHREYFKLEAVPAEFDWHYHHNLDLLASSRQYLGQMKQAAVLRQRSFDLPSNLVVQVYNKREWPSFLRSRGRVEDAAAAAKRLSAHPHPLAQAAGHIEAGYALVAAGRGGDAATAANTALRILRGGAEGGAMAAPALLGLQGEIALRTADREKGRRLMLDAAGRWRALPGPDGWVQALYALEAMAHSARQVGDWALAGQMAQQLLAHDPMYAGTHYALALVAEHEGDVKTARAEFALAQKQWSQADADLAEMADIRKHSQ